MTTSVDDKFNSTFKFSGNNYEDAVLEFPKLVDALELMAGRHKVGYLLSEDLVKAHMQEPSAPELENEFYEDGSKNHNAKLSNRMKLQNYDAEMTLWRKRRDVHDQEWATLQTCLGSLLVPQSNAHTLFKSSRLGIISFKEQYKAQWKALCKWEPKLSSDVDVLVEKLKSIDDSSGWGQFEGEWNDIIGKLKAIVIDDKVAIPEDVNDIFAKAVTNSNMRVIVIKDYYEGKEDSNTWELMMGRISRLIRKNKDWDTVPKNASSVKISALSISTGGGLLGKRGLEKPGGHCFCCGNADHHCNMCRASSCESCGMKFDNYEDRKGHIGNCPNRNDNLSKTKFAKGKSKNTKDSPSEVKSGNYYGPNKKSRFSGGESGGASEGAMGRTVFAVNARSAKVIAKALQAIQPSKSGSPGQSKA